MAAQKLRYRARTAEKISELGMDAYPFHAPFASDIDISSSDPAQRKLSVAEICNAVRAAAILSPPDRSKSRTGAKIGFARER